MILGFEVCERETSVAYFKIMTYKFYSYTVECHEKFQVDI